MPSQALLLSKKLAAERLAIEPGFHGSLSRESIDATYKELTVYVNSLPDWKDRVHSIATKGRIPIMAAATALGGPQAGVAAGAALTVIAGLTDKTKNPSQALSDEDLLDLVSAAAAIFTAGKTKVVDPVDDHGDPETSDTVTLLSKTIFDAKDAIVSKTDSTTKHDDRDPHNPHTPDPHHPTDPPAHQVGDGGHYDNDGNPVDENGHPREGTPLPKKTKKSK